MALLTASTRCSSLGRLTVQDDGDLVAKLKADPGSVGWGGGSTGGTDPHPRRPDSKGGRRRSDEGEGHRHSAGRGRWDRSRRATAAGSGLEEFAPEVRAGKLRALSIHRDERLPGSTCRRSKEQCRTCRWSLARGIGRRRAATATDGARGSDGEMVQKRKVEGHSPKPAGSTCTAGSRSPRSPGRPREVATTLTDIGRCKGALLSNRRS